MDIRDVLNDWIRWIEDGDPNKNHTVEIIHESWSPKWKWFQPPMWKVFRWAYSIDRTILKNCYPASCDINDTGT